MERRLTIQLPKGGTRVIPLTAPVYIVGRGVGCQIRIADPSLSRKHARLLVSEAQCVLEDLESGNGCLVNGRRVTESTLADGDSLKFGRVVAVYSERLPAETEPSGADRRHARTEHARQRTGKLRGYLEGKDSRSVDPAALRARAGALVTKTGLHWRRKLVLLTAGILLVGGMVIGGILRWQARDVWMERAVNALRPFAADNRFVLELGLESTDRLSGAMVEGDARIANPVVLSPEGTVLWPKKQAGMSWDNWPDAQLDYREEFYRLGTAPGAPETRQLFLVPVRSRGQHLGWVAAEWDRRVAGDLGVPWGIVFISMGFLALLAYVVYEGASAWVSRPLQAFTDELRSRSVGEQLRLTPPADVPELVELADAVQIAIAAKRGVSKSPAKEAASATLHDWVEGLPVATALLDEGYRVVAVNSEGVRLLGVRQEGGDSIGRALGGEFFGVQVIQMLKSCVRGRPQRGVLDSGPPGSRGPVTVLVSRPQVAAGYAIALVIVPTE